MSEKKLKIKMKELPGGPRSHVIKHEKYFYGNEYVVGADVAEELVSTGYADYVESSEPKPKPKDRSEQFQPTFPKRTRRKARVRFD